MKARTSAVAAVLVGISVAFVGAQAQQQAGPTPIQSGFGQGAYRPGPGSGVTDPQLLREARPTYTADGMRAKIQGVVELEAVVLANGIVGDVRVTKSLDTTFGLDAEAIRAAKQWLFKPGSVNGVAVPTLVTLILEFRLSRNPPPADALPTVTPVRPGGGVSDPVLIKEVKPAYPAEIQPRVRAVVELEAVVAPDGRVTEVKVIKAQDRRFETEAVAAARQWLFKPGYADGKPVPVLVTLILEIRPDGSVAPLTPGDEFLKGVTREGDAGAVAPRLISQPRPNYTSEAMRRKVQGVVEIEAVVLPDGSVARARVVQSIDPSYGLDDEAVAAAKKARFEPNSGTLNGTPVPCLVRLKMEFRLH